MLQVQHLSKAFGGLKAADDITLTPLASGTTQWDNHLVALI